MRREGAVFAFEGPDGVGKTTLVSAVAELLGAVGRRLSLSFFGRATKSCAHIYDLHHGNAGHDVHRLTPDALQILHIAAHVDAIQSAIRPHVKSGGVVLLDRYWWSTWVYGRLDGVRVGPLRRMIALERAYWGKSTPRAIFLLARPGEAVNPARRAVFIQRAGEYDRLATREEANAPVIRLENSGDIQTVAAAAVRAILIALSSASTDTQSGNGNAAGGTLPHEDRQMPLYRDNKESETKGTLLLTFYRRFGCHLSRRSPPRCSNPLAFCDRTASDLLSPTAGNREAMDRRPNPEPS